MRAFKRALAAASATLLAAHAAPASAVLSPTLFPTVRQIEADGAVALTFDDGPDLSLNAFLRVLEEHGARATFFVVGEQVERVPGRLEEILSGGHEVAVHCHRHRNHLRLTPGQTVEDMRRAKGIIEEAAQCPTQLFRPPYGVFNLASWLEAGRQGWERVLWTRWGRDWEARATPRSIAREIGQPEAGDILLLHDSDRYAAQGSQRKTLKALPIILENLSALGLVARPVGELLDANDQESGITNRKSSGEKNRESKVERGRAPTIESSQSLPPTPHSLLPTPRSGAKRSDKTC